MVLDELKHLLYTILFFYRTKSNQSRRLSSIGFGNRTSSNTPKSSSSIMFDCRTNRTPIERLGSIGFWFGFVRLTTLGEKYNPHLFCSRSERKIRLMIWGCICYDGAAASSLKIRLVVISSRAIATHDVFITTRD